MKQEKYGFVYLWYDKKHKRYYLGCHWGSIDDSYICSSSWMTIAHKRRPQDFKRRILKTNIQPRPQMYVEEQRFLDMIKPEERKVRYYNLNLKNFDSWHKYPEHIKTVGQKISASKKGKSTGPCSPEKAKKISEAKKAAFNKRRDKDGYVHDEETRKRYSDNRRGKSHTVEWKQANSERMNQQWNDGTRKRKVKQKKMTIVEQGKLHGSRLKDRWADPVWRKNQRQKLKAGAKKRAMLNRTELLLLAEE